MVGTMIVMAAFELTAAQVVGAYMAAAMAINFAVSMVVSRAFAPKLSTGDDNGTRQQIPPSSTNAVPVVYGDAYLGGTFVDAVLSTNQKMMYYVLAVSSISPNGQFTFDTTDMYYGDRKITFDAADPAKVISLTDDAGNVDTKISNKLYIGLYTSTEAGVITSANGWYAPSVVMGPSSPFLGDDKVPAAYYWPSTGRQMNGLAFAIVCLYYDQEAQTTSMQPVTFKVKHALNGTGVAKPGDVWYDYMTSEKYGGAVDPSYIDTSSVAALNTYADELVTFQTYTGSPSTQPRYRVNGVLNAGDPVLNNINRIMTCSDSWMTYRTDDGRWSVIVNKAEAPAYSFDDSNIIGDIRVSVTDLTSSVNQIEATFPFKDNRDQPEVVNIAVPPALLYPNEPVNKLTTNFELVNDSVTAQYLANRILEQAREDLIISFNTTYYGIQVNAGEVVEVTNAAYGWTNKLFRVMKVNEASLPDGSLGARLELNEYNAQVYDDRNITEFTPVPNSGISAPQYFSALGTPVVTASRPSAAVPSFDVEVTVPATGRVTYLQLFFTTSSSPSASDWKLYTTASSSNSAPYTPGIAFTFLNCVFPAGTYYFAYKVGNERGASTLSGSSLQFVWTPTAGVGPTGPTGSSITGPTGATGATGTPANQTATAYLYQWSPTTPTNPSGTSTYTWATASSSAYTGGGGWSTTIPTNPGTPGIYLWVASKAVVDLASATTTSVSWASGYSVVASSGNGVDGVKTASPTVYQWATTIPTISGTSTYTWSSKSFTPVPSGWSTSISTAPSPGYTLWAASVQISDTATATTTSVNWTTASIISAGYSGTNGATGPTGSSGTSGASARVMYARIASNPTPTAGTVSVSGDNRPTGAQASAVWGASFNVTWYASDPNPSSNDSLYQADGIYNGSTTVWSAPYISSLKVGNLSAVSTNTGSLTVTGDLTMGTLGAIKGGQTAYNTGTGFFLGYSSTTYKFSIGSSTRSLTWDGSNLNIVGTGTFKDSGSLYPNTYIELGINGNGNVCRVYRSDNTLLPPFYVYDTLSSAGVAAAWISAANNNGLEISSPNKIALQLSGNNFVATPVVDVIGYRQENQLRVRSYASSGSSSTHGARFQYYNLSGALSTSAIAAVANGTNAFYAEVGSYGPFTGAHDAVILNTATVVQGDILVDVRCISKPSISQTLFEVTTSSQANVPAIGVYVSSEPWVEGSLPAALIDVDHPVITGYSDPADGGNPIPIYSYPPLPIYYEIKDDYTDITMNALGEGLINVCGEGGDLQSGDLIVSSSIPGKGMKQADDVVRSITVAKCRENVSFSSPTEIKQVACIYLCG